MQLGRVVVGDRKPGAYSFFNIFFYCGDTETITTRTRTNLVGILGVCGGFATIIMLATRITASFYN